MKTSKERRQGIKIFCEMQGMSHTGLPTHSEIIELIDDLDTQAARVALLEEALERIVRFNPSYEYTFENARSISKEALQRSKELG